MNSSPTDPPPLNSEILRGDVRNSHRPRRPDGQGNVELVGLPQPPQYLLDYLGLARNHDPIKDPLNILFGSEPEEDVVWSGRWLSNSREDLPKPNSSTTGAGSVREHYVQQSNKFLYGSLLEPNKSRSAMLLRQARSCAVLALASPRTQKYENFREHRRRLITEGMSPTATDDILRKRIDKMFSYVYRMERAWNTDKEYNPVGKS
ncbi:hypothetical protein QBC44DRAFT_328683 [Cladorrhinum sp. PSN332]|nr:hypothetical protein QBC44DRAFT_328683 [Cladorrhinum sp. PSN332]